MQDHSNTKLLSALLILILLQVNSGLFHKLQNVKLLEKLHSLHSDFCIHCNRLNEANMRIMSSVKPEIRFAKMQNSLTSLTNFWESIVIFNKNIYAICNRFIILRMN